MPVTCKFTFLLDHEPATTFSYIYLLATNKRCPLLHRNFACLGQIQYFEAQVTVIRANKLLFSLSLYYLDTSEKSVGHLSPSFVGMYGII